MGLLNRILEYSFRKYIDNALFFIKTAFVAHVEKDPTLSLQEALKKSFFIQLDNERLRQEWEAKFNELDKHTSLIDDAIGLGPLSPEDNRILQSIVAYLLTLYKKNYRGEPLSYERIEYICSRPLESFLQLKAWFIKQKG